MDTILQEISFHKTKKKTEGRYVLIISFLPFACQKSSFFHLAGYEQESFSNDADILFVIDNSSSMKEEAQSLGNNFNVFINLFASNEGATESTRSLSDAVDNSHPM